MAWNEPGGGNKKGPNDPWGGGDQGPPDLDEALKKLQENTYKLELKKWYYLRLLKTIHHCL